MDIALGLNPQYVDAMAYKNLLLRLKADTTQDASERARLIGEADSWFNKALEARSQNPTGGNRNAAGSATTASTAAFLTTNDSAWRYARRRRRRSGEPHQPGPTGLSRARHARHVFREWSYCRLRSIRRARWLDLRSFRGTLS